MNRHFDIPPLDPSLISSSHFPNHFGNGGGDSGRGTVVPPSHRSSMPPIPPYSQIPTTRQPTGWQNFSSGPSLSRSMSQSSPVFSLDTLQLLSPSPSAFQDSPQDVALPPIPFKRSNSVRKAHRRSNSDIITGLNSQLIYPKPIEMLVGVGSHGEGVDELLYAYMNLDKGSNETEDDMDSNSEASESGDTKSGLVVKRRAGNEIASSSRHRRSISMDGCLIGMFTASETKKIVGSSKLTELAASNPKYVKRILANRESAARSKERKAQYVSELEYKVQMLQTEATTLSAQFKHLQRDNMVLEVENKELMIHLQNMEQKAQLRDTLIEQLKVEVERLQVATGQVSQNGSESDSSDMLSLSSNMFQQLNINQLHQSQTNPDFE